MNRIISRNKSYVVQDKKTNQVGDNIGRIVIMEFKAQDSTAFDDMLAFVKQHPDFEKLEISYEPTLSLSSLEINLSRRRVINNGQEIFFVEKTIYFILYLSEIFRLHCPWHKHYTYADTNYKQKQKYSKSFFLTAFSLHICAHLPTPKLLCAIF
jgi:hypothetical protein